MEDERHSVVGDQLFMGMVGDDLSDAEKRLFFVSFYVEEVEEEVEVLEHVWGWGGKMGISQIL